MARRRAKRRGRARKNPIRHVFVQRLGAKGKFPWVPVAVTGAVVVAAGLGYWWYSSAYQVGSAQLNSGQTPNSATIAAAQALWTEITSNNGQPPAYTPGQGPSDPTVLAFQQAWNADPASANQISVDGEYGQQTQTALGVVLGQTAPAPVVLSVLGGGGGGSTTGGGGSAAGGGSGTDTSAPGVNTNTGTQTPGQVNPGNVTDQPSDTGA